MWTPAGFTDVCPRFLIKNDCIVFTCSDYIMKKRKIKGGGRERMKLEICRIPFDKRGIIMYNY